MIFLEFLKIIKGVWEKKINKIFLSKNPLECVCKYTLMNKKSFFLFVKSCSPKHSIRH